MSSYELFETGDPSQWGELISQRFAIVGKRYLDKDVALEFMGASVNELAPGMSAPFWHTHAILEELYIVIAGVGEFALDEKVVAVRPGSVLRVGQNVLRTWRCHPDSVGPMRWICVRAGGAKLADIPPDAKPITDKPFPWN